MRPTVVEDAGLTRVHALRMLQGLPVHRRLQGTRPLILLYAALGIAALITYFAASGGISAIAYLLVSILPVVALVVGPYLLRPSSMWPWYMLAAGQVAFLAGDLIWYADDLRGIVTGYPSIADVAYVAGYPLLAAGLVLFIQHHQPAQRLASLVDAFAIGISATLVLWLVDIGTFIHDASLPFMEKLMLIAYPIGDALLLGAAAYLFLIGGRVGMAQRLIVVSLGSLLVADVLYSGMFLAEDYTSGWADGLWMLSYLLIGVAALVPSMRNLTELGMAKPVVRDRRHLLVLFTALVVVPLFAGLQQVRFGRIDAEVIVITEVVLVLLLVLRTRDLTGAALRDAAKLRFQAQLLANIGESVVASDMDGRITHWNAAASTLYGYSSDEMLGRSIAITYPNLNGSMVAHLRDTLRGRDHVGERQIMRKDGSSAWVHGRIRPMRNDQGAAIGFIGVDADITERRRAIAHTTRLSAAIEQSSESVMIADVKGTIEYVNPAFERTSGYSRAEIVGQNPRILQSGVQPPSYYEAMWATLSAGRPWIGDFTNRRKDGTHYQEEAVITPIHDETGLLTGYVAVKRDVTAENHLKQRALELARERALIAQTLRGLDGHDAPRATAEAICRQVVSLSEVAMAALFVFDHEGRAEPYGIVIPGEGKPPMRRVPSLRSAHLRDRASSGPWIEAWLDRPSHPYNEILARLGVRAGAYVPIRDTSTVIGYLYIGCATQGAEDLMVNNLAALVEFADIAGALLGAKITESAKDESVRRRVRRVIGRCEFRPVFQPLVDIQAQLVVGYEALTRFDDVAPPDKQFEEAAGVGLRDKLELATMRTALQAAVVLPADAWLNLNVSPDVVISSRELPRLLASVDRDIVLEITEHVAITDYPAFRAAVARLGPRIRVAVDDAGAGFSSLRHILELQPAFVKIDRSLVKNIDADEARQALVAGFGHFAAATGCVLIAEGVETEAELATLRRLAITIAQGYLLGRPAALQPPPEEGAAAAKVVA